MAKDFVPLAQKRLNLEISNGPENTKGALAAP
jgi:hypothetical protein